jgi:hypothetical protein
MEWSRETYINCTYDVEEYSQIRFPGRWLKEGLQIKTLYPFELKPWHTYDKKKQLILWEVAGCRYFSSCLFGRTSKSITY